MKLDWNKIFGEAHLHSWPTASLCIQNVNPSKDQGSRNIFEDDEKEILAAAKTHGYARRIGSKIVTFINPTMNGLAHENAKSANAPAHRPERG